MLKTIKKKTAPSKKEEQPVIKVIQTEPRVVEIIREVPAPVDVQALKNHISAEVQKLDKPPVGYEVTVERGMNERINKAYIMPIGTKPPERKTASQLLYGDN